MSTPSPWSRSSTPWAPKRSRRSRPRPGCSPPAPFALELAGAAKGRCFYLRAAKEARRRLAVEIDRGTLSGARFRRKLRAWERYGGWRGRESDEPACSYLVVATSWKRLGERYELGGLTREQFLAQRAALKRELERLPTEPGDDGEHEAALRRLGAHLQDVALAWDDASPELRNKLARSLFREVWIMDDRVLAIRPRPELAALFESAYAPPTRQRRK